MLILQCLTYLSPKPSSGRAKGYIAPGCSSRYWVGVKSK
nr:MAG TPA: Fe-S metabolism associated domain [Caudoviricetes sp.]